MNVVQEVLFGGLAGTVAVAIWVVHARHVARASVPVVLVRGTDGRTREVPLDELERRLDRR